MSQHLCDSIYQGKRVRVMSGWDRRVQSHFLVISRLPQPSEGQEKAASGDDKEDDFVYSNLDDPKLAGTFAGGADLDYFKRVLDDMGIKVPEALMREVEADRLANAGNRVVFHNNEGSTVT